MKVLGIPVADCRDRQRDNPALRRYPRSGPAGGARYQFLIRSGSSTISSSNGTGSDVGIGEGLDVAFGAGRGDDSYRAGDAGSVHGVPQPGTPCQDG